MADYSGYAPRQQQRQPQDPWAEGALGMAKLFMPDQETQLAARRFQQNEDLFQSRLLDAEVARENAANRDTYEKKRLAQLDEHKLLHEERGRILARAAKQNRDLTRAEAARLAAINGTIRGTVSPTEVSGFFALPEATKRAQAKAAAGEQEKATKATQDALAEKAKVEARRSDEFKGLHGKHSERIDTVRLKNNIQNMFNNTAYARSAGFKLTDEAADAIAAAGADLGYTEAEMIDAARALLLKMDTDTTGARLPVVGATGDQVRFQGKRKYSDEQIAAMKRDFRGDDAAWAAEAKKYKSLVNLSDADMTTLTGLTRDPKVLRVRGTPAFIRAFAIKNPGKKILFMNTETGQYGGGIASQLRAPADQPEPEYQNPEESDANFEGGRVLLDWEDQ
jgi:hypothetical protein